MEIEIVEFYPQPPKDGKITSGSIHAYIADLNMDLKFCWAYQKNKNWKFELPARQVTVDGSKVKVPIVSFIDVEKQKDLRKSFNIAARKFMAEWEKDNS